MIPQLFAWFRIGCRFEGCLWEGLWHVPFAFRVGSKDVGRQGCGSLFQVSIIAIYTLNRSPFAPIRDANGAFPLVEG